MCSFAKFESSQCRQRSFASCWSERSRSVLHQRHPQRKREAAYSSEAATRVVRAWAHYRERTKLFAGEPCANRLAATTAGSHVEGGLQRYQPPRWPANVQERQVCPWVNGRLCEVQRRWLRVAVAVASRRAVFTIEPWVGSTSFKFVEEAFATRRCFSRRLCQRCSELHWKGLLKANSYRWSFHKCYMVLATSYRDQPTKAG